MQTNECVSIKDMSLAVFTRNVGFDLSIYEEYSKPIQNELRRRTINNAVREIKISFEEKGIDLVNISKGVYVISLSRPLMIKYRYNRSDIIYIGMGNVLTRVKGHFHASLFDFMQSLSGANFDFHFSLPHHAEHADYHKHVEYLMLEHFCETYGGTDDKRRFPLLNKNAGSNKNIIDGGDWWKRPLRNTGKKPLWTLLATEHSDFAPLD